MCHHIYEKQTEVSKKELSTTPSIQYEEDKIGTIAINKIKLNQPLYQIDSIHNNVEENVTILKESILPEEENSILFLAAHSGEGKIAYFNNLDKLQIGDKIKINYNNKLYIYRIDDIWEEEKTGYIHINKSSNKQLVLTTCSPHKKNKQLIINSNLIA